MKKIVNNDIFNTITEYIIFYFLHQQNKAQFITLF